MVSPALWLPALLAGLTGVAGAAEDAEYGARVDPWLKEYTEAVRVSEDQVLIVRLYQGTLTALAPDGSAEIPLMEEQQQELMGLFPQAARAKPLDDAAWATKLRLHAAAPQEDASCAVNGENHLEKAVVEVFSSLKGASKQSILNIGGLYGGQHGSEEDKLDDPTVELLRHMPAARVLCWNCEDVAAVTRVGSLASRFRTETMDVLDPDLRAPPGFRELDLLRLDFLPRGQSCQVLRRLLRGGVRPRLVAMLVLSQVPPPFKFTPLSTGEGAHPEALFSCSLAAAAEVASAYDLFLVRLTGPYALFAHRDAWSGELPISDLACYRAASVWGHKSLPIDFVREWLFAPVEASLPFLWSNITAIYEVASGGQQPFTLAL